MLPVEGGYYLIALGLALSTFMTGPSRQRLRQQIELRPELSRGLKAAAERPLGH